MDDSLDEDEDHTETDCQSAVEPHDAGSGSNNYSEIQNIYSRCSIDRSTEHFQDPKRKKRQKAVADAANVSRNNNTQNDNNGGKVDPDDLKKPAHTSWSRIEDDTIQASQDQQTSNDEDDDEKNIISRSSGNDTARLVGLRS